MTMPMFTTFHALVPGWRVPAGLCASRGPFASLCRGNGDGGRCGHIYAGKLTHQRIMFIMFAARHLHVRKNQHALP